MNVVVVGGGFGGVKAALELSKRKIGKITLISDEDYFLHHATLYATATGMSRSESVIPLKDIFIDHPNVTVVQDTVQSIDPARRLIIGKAKQYRYDTAILALGSVTTYCNINGMKQHAYGIKSLKEIAAFHQHIREEIVEKKFDKEYFVIGAGLTGVELAGALNEHLQYLITTNHLNLRKARVTLVEAAERILPKSSATASKIVGKRLKKLGIYVLVDHKVEALDDDMITIKGKKIPTTTAIWTSGVANNPFFTAHEHVFKLAHNGRVNVSPYLEALPNVYVIGDSNSVKHSGQAWAAMHQARFVAKHLARISKNRMKLSFHPRSAMSGLPVGKGWGYVEWLGTYVAGRSGALVRRWMELYGYNQLLPFAKAVAIWRAHDVPQVDE